MRSHLLQKNRSRRPSPLSGWLLLLLRRIILIAVIAFAIAYFCVLGMRLGVNSTTSGQPRTVWETAGPALRETIDFFRDAASGDLGYTVRGVTRRTRVPVTEVVRSAYIESARLLVAAMGLAAVVGVLAGGLAAVKSHTPLALSTLTLTVIGVSIPSFFLALLLRVADILFYRHTGVGLVPVFSSGLDRTQSLLPSLTFPALVLAARPLAHITRVTFIALSDILQRDYIRTAHAKGLRPGVVFGRHALRNGGVSILTGVLVSFRFAVGSLPVAEIFFDWPGVGATMLDSIYRGEVNTVVSLALSLGMTFLLLTLLLDGVYRLVDPRLRGGVNGGGA